MNPNLERYDLSEWLIHFTRPVDVTGDTAPAELPFEWGFGEAVEEDSLSPFFLIRRILRQRQILSTWSMRKDRPTVYGLDPAVCFTEMPLAAFLHSSQARASRGENISSYAVLLPKDQAYREGARPVIYDLSDPEARAAMKSDGTRRFPASVLPEIEQYRYVAFNPSLGGGLDWSHEREWRWPNRDAVTFNSYDIPDEASDSYEAWTAWSEARENGRHDGDGLCLDLGGFDGIGLLVKSSRQVKLLMHDILWLVDAGVVSRTLFSFVLQLDKLPEPASLRERAAAAAEIRAATVPLSPFYLPDDQAAQARRASLNSIIREVCDDPRQDTGEFGGCWLWLMDNTHPLTRALLSAPEEDQRISVSKLGRYLVWMPELGDGRGLQLRQELTSEIARRVKQEFGLPATYFSVLNSDNMDDVPFYANGCTEIHMNYAHDADDY